MKVIIQNEKICAYAAKHGLDENALAQKCEISALQAKNLLKKRQMNLNVNVIIRFCNNTGFKFSSVFTVLEYDEREEYGLNILQKYYDGNDKFKVGNLSN